MEKERNISQWQQAAEVELVYKTNVKPSDRPQVTSCDDTVRLLRQIWNPEKIELVEEFKVLLLNRANKVLGVFNVSSGGLTGTVADPRLILTAAVKSNTCNLIIAHNHPSGSLKPSTADEEITWKIKSAAAFFDIKLLDHIILTSENYFSFAEEGLL